MIVQGIFLWAVGPYLASYITANLMEQASIWCFFSIAQIGVMLFLIRKYLILGWPRTKKEDDGFEQSKASKKANSKKAK